MRYAFHRLGFWYNGIIMVDRHRSHLRELIIIIASIYAFWSFGSGFVWRVV